MSMKTKHTVGKTNGWAELLKLDGPLKRAQSSNLQHRYTHATVPTTKARHLPRQHDSHLTGTRQQGVHMWEQG